MIQRKKWIPFLVVLLIALLGTPVINAQDSSDDDEMMNKLERLLEEEQTEEETSDPDEQTEEDEELDAIEKANRKLHGDEGGPESREKKNPMEVLNDIIEEMDTAARSLEDNTRQLTRVEQKLKELRKQAGDDPSKSQKETIRRIKELFEKSKKQQEGVSSDMKDLLSLKKKFSSASSSQKQSISGIEQLIKRAQQAQKSQSQGGGQKKQRQKSSKRQKKQNKKSSKKNNKNNPANKPYEDTSQPPEEIKKVHTGEATPWGKLPPKVRDEIIQRQSENYVPGYAERLREYYKKLGEDTNQ